jgi:hypothetical protein
MVMCVPYVRGSPSLALRMRHNAQRTLCICRTKSSVVFCFLAC